MTNAQVSQVGSESCEILSALHATSFSRPWNNTAFKTLLEQPGVTGWIYEDSVPLGFILVRAAANEAEVLTFAVLPKHRRQGIGKLLLNTARSTLRAAGTHQLFLEVSEENLAALTLYQKLGFAPLGKRTAYYNNDASNAARTSTDAIIMGLEI